MRCKPGDICIVVRACARYADWLGRIVTVRKHHDLLLAAWYIDPHPIDDAGMEVGARDEDLRPLNDPGVQQEIQHEQVQKPKEAIA